jgi:hypothetical protein
MGVEDAFFADVAFSVEVLEQEDSATPRRTTNNKR